MVLCSSKLLTINVMECSLGARNIVRECCQDVTFDNLCSGCNLLSMSYWWVAFFKTVIQKDFNDPPLMVAFSFPHSLGS
jgi:hypothetical protein